MSEYESDDDWRFRNSTNEERRRAECQDIANSLKEVRSEIDEKLDEVDMFWLFRLDQAIEWFEEIGVGADPKKVILTANPKAKTLRNDLIIQHVDWMRRQNVPRREAEKRVAKEFGMKTGTVRKVITDTNKKEA